MSAIGYREIAAHLEGETTLAEALQQMRRASRKFVRHQANWFRESDPSIRWFTPSAGYEASVIEWVGGRLRDPNSSC
jgi:tRNA dimethylallyltransferase